MPLSALVKREERKKVEEPCVWYSPEKDEIHEGVILNESASGILIESKNVLEIDQQIWILSHPGIDSSSLANTPEDLINHPLSRYGVIVRHGKSNQMGVQFDLNISGHPVYQHWYRGTSCVTTLFAKDRAVINVSGAIRIDVAALIERLLKEQIQRFSEILFSFHDVNEINGTALTVLGASLRKCDQEGISLIIITGPAKNNIFDNRLKLKHAIIAPIDSVPVTATVSNKPAPVPTKAKPDTPSSPVAAEVVEEGVLVVSRSISELNRLCIPIERQQIITIKTKKFMEVPEIISSHPPLFVVIDVELEQCTSLISVNKIKKKPVAKFPPCLVLGPPHLGELIKEALALPVKFYLTKPFTESEYGRAIQRMLKKDYPKSPKAGKIS